MARSDLFFSQFPSTKNPRWVVLEGDWGGTIFSTVPVHLLPSDITVGEIQDALDAMNAVIWSCQPGEGMEVDVYEDRGYRADRDGSWRGPKRLEEYDAYVRLSKDLPQHIQLATLWCRPFAPDVRLNGWLAVGGVGGGMGGGLLLQDHMWFHECFLCRCQNAQKMINHFLSILRLPPLSSLDLILPDPDTQELEDD